MERMAFPDAVVRVYDKSASGNSVALASRLKRSDLMVRDRGFEPLTPTVSR